MPSRDDPPGNPDKDDQLLALIVASLGHIPPELASVPADNFRLIGPGQAASFLNRGSCWP